MSKVIASASMSLDGFVADEHDDPGPLFEWYDAGEVVCENAGTLPAFHLTEASAAYWRAWTASVGALVVGRRLFDITDGWDDTHPLGVPVVVLTHDPPTDPRWVEAASTGSTRFVTTGIEDAVAAAREIAGDRDVGVAAGTVATQALAAGLLDAVAIDLVPVVLGSGHRYFTEALPDAFRRLGDPVEVVPSTRVTHLLLPVER